MLEEVQSKAKRIFVFENKICNDKLKEFEMFFIERFLAEL